ncbi:hypothetical protein [Bradyrhizobium sp. URHD0069]|uniref:hypothetical protein n=1 Tax=Bradyrhizobium sp. URHD0069 TaxID=1380355 RepID=UPI0012DEF30D|nr:hypothetical protein [Bradyrhizobium sp. URHD0069]
MNSLSGRRGNDERREGVLFITDRRASFTNCCIPDIAAYRVRPGKGFGTTSAAQSPAADYVPIDK